jgi:hypothetical protein
MRLLQHQDGALRRFGHPTAARGTTHLIGQARRAQPIKPFLPIEERVTEIPTSAPKSRAVRPERCHMPSSSTRSSGRRLRRFSSAGFAGRSVVVVSSVIALPPGGVCRKVEGELVHQFHIKERPTFR